MNIKFLLMLLLIISPGATIAGTVYKWVDAEGNVTYSQQPPPKEAELKNTFKTPHPKAVEENEKNTDPALVEKKAEEKKEKKIDEKSSEDTNNPDEDENCKQAKTYRDALKASNNKDVVIRDEQGNLTEVSKLDPSDLAEKIEESERLVKAHCSALAPSPAHKDPIEPKAGADSGQVQPVQPE